MSTPPIKATTSSIEENEESEDTKTMKRIQVRMSPYLLDRIDKEYIQTAIFPNRNRFFDHITREFLDHKKTGGTMANDSGENLMPFLQEQNKFFTELKELLGEASHLPRPEDYEKKVNRIVEHLRIPRTFTDLTIVSDVPDSELLIILGTLLNSGTIAYDSEWRYYLTKPNQKKPGAK
jgi:hypothetical protein